jgi:enoyl-CoA hydratase/carnithine racemase
MTYTRFTLENSTSSLWRVTFDNPPINLIDSVMIGELRDLFAEVERDRGPTVLVLGSADSDYLLAHYDITAANRSLVDSLPPGPTGFHPWIDLLVRLSKLPAVTISAIRGRARGAGSEFVLACEMLVGPIVVVNPSGSYA